MKLALVWNYLVVLEYLTMVLAVRGQRARFQHVLSWQIKFIMASGQFISYCSLMFY